MINLMNAALYTKLQASTALTSLLAGTTAIYSTQAPDNAAFPYVVFSLQAGGDENFDAHRTKNLIFYIRAYSKTSEAQAGSIDSAVDSAIHQQTLSVSGWANFWTAREQDITLIENLQSGAKIWTSGGLYRVRIEDT